MKRVTHIIEKPHRKTTYYGIVDSGGALVFGVEEIASEQLPLSLGIFFYYVVSGDSDSGHSKACMWTDCKPCRYQTWGLAGESMLMVFLSQGRDAMWRELEAMFTRRLLQ